MSKVNFKDVEPVTAVPWKSHWTKGLEPKLLDKDFSSQCLLTLLALCMVILNEE